MLSVLAQASYDYTYTTTTTNNAGGLAALGAFAAIFAVIGLVLAVVMVVSMWKIFTKAGVEGWKAIVPFYNCWVLAEIVGRPGWWGLASLVGLVAFIPVIGWLAEIAAFVVFILIYLDLAKSFGKTTGFAVLLILLPIIGFPMLAFGDAKYGGPAAKSAGSKPAAPAAPSAPAAKQ
jgi:hypothetical protein